MHAAFTDGALAGTKLQEIVCRVPKHYSETGNLERCVFGGARLSFSQVAIAGGEMRPGLLAIGGGQWRCTTQPARSRTLGNIPENESLPLYIHGSASIRIQNIHIRYPAGYVAEVPDFER